MKSSIMNIQLILLVFYCVFKLSLGCVYLEGPHGLLQGRQVPIPDTNRTFYAFQEMSYAQPPVGDLRFQPPQPISNWTGVKDATRNSKICYQIGRRSPQETEDCLYLNVYTPELPSKEYKEGLAVMVYFHGGGFMIGDGTYENYGPHYFMKYDVVIVTLNYRLGVYGFLSTQDEVIPGNNGLKDQLLALQWVSQNIRVFGGDPYKVTIFGQDSGAASAGYHLLNPKSEGLYRGAIMQSGSPLSPWAYQRNAKTYAFKLAESLKSNVETSEELLALLKSAKVEDINKAADEIVNEETYDNAQLLQGFYFAPTIEPAIKGAFLTEKMYEVLAEGNSDTVPIMMGFNSEEALTSRTSVDSLKKILANFDEDQSALIPKDINAVIPEDVKRLGDSIKKWYVTPDDHHFVDEPGSGLTYFSDTAFTRSIIMHATLQSVYSKVYFYEFAYDGVLGNNSVQIDEAGSVGHGEEVPYFWKTSCESSAFPEADLKTRLRVLVMWTYFAKKLNPTPNDFDDDLANKSWNKFQADTRIYLLIREILEDGKIPRASFQMWNGLYNAYGHRPFDTY